MGYCDEKKINLMKAIILALLILFSISTSAQTFDEFIELDMYAKIQYYGL